MDKQEYRLYLAMLKARKAMADNARRREQLKTQRHTRSDDIKNLLSGREFGVSVDGLLASDDELEARERAFAK
ncbi:hypothetical protein [Serratia sp. CY85251]|uniref:hypothetical protein n=1 Tax=Serratia sp. CY85251 TaxID=3383696 RepID=UPI003FA0B7F0